MYNKLSHIAFIMDGNNRWSEKKSLSKYESYKRGASKLISLSNYIFSNTKVDTISAFALSKNNLQSHCGNHGSQGDQRSHRQVNTGGNDNHGHTNGNDRSFGRFIGKSF